MSVLDNNIPERQLEGPPRLLHEHIREVDLRENPAIIGFISMREYLIANYGQENVGWAAEPIRYQAELEVTSTLLASHLAVPARNIDVVVYPDGDAYHHQKYI